MPEERLVADPQSLERLSRGLGAKFEVVRLVGRGGFAEVYEVRDHQLHRRLAVKVLREDIAWTQGMLQRFEEEARALARLSHPNILPIHFVGEREGLVYYAMPFIEGRTLAEILAEEGPLPAERAALIGRSILEALEHAHQKGMIHRDIKPANILIEDETGRPLLVDFGIAKRMDDSPSTTQSGFVVGTPTYMSPEQALGHDHVDHRSDLYAVGGVLFHAVTGVPPYAGDTSQEVIGRHISQAIPIPALLNQNIPEWFSDVVVKALAKRADDRYQSAAEMAEDLRRGMRTGARPPGAGDDAARERIRHDDPTAIIPAHQTGESPAPGAAPVLPEVVHQRSEEAAAPRRRGRRSEDRAVPRGPGRRRSDLEGLRSWSWRQLAGWVLVLAALFGTIAYFTRVQLSLAIANRLTLPVRFLSESGEEKVIPPGGRFAQPMPEGGKALLQWSVLRPKLDDQGEVGVSMDGIIRVDGATFMELVRRKITRDIDSWDLATGNRYFSPLITNLTDRPIRVSVNPNSRLEGCYCLVPPGATRQSIGYYQLLDDTSIRVSDTQGRFAIFRNLEQKVDSYSGAVEIRVDPETMGTKVRPRTP